MKHIFVWVNALTLAFVATVSFGSRTATAAPVVRVEPSLSMIAIGKSFDISINISSVADLYGFQFDISFNPSVLMAGSVVEGSLLPIGGATFFIPGTVDNALGVITFTADALIAVASGVTGDGTLAIVHFDARGQGVSSVNVSALSLLDSNIIDIPASTVGAIVNVIGTVPEPDTLLLTGVGLFALIGYVLRKNALRYWPTPSSSM